MSEQKMREALERLAAYPYGRNDELGVAKMRSIAREALAQQPAAVVELTDDEIEASVRSDRRPGTFFDRIDFARAVIAAHIAKQGGAA